MRHICAVIATTLLAGSAFADTINVPGDYPNIQNAVDMSSNGDVILVEAGTYTGTGQEVVILQGKNLTIRSVEGAEHTFIDGEALRRGITIYDSDCTIEGFTITNGQATNGAGIHISNYSNPTITECTVESNTALSDGGGIFANGYGSPTMHACTIINNSSYRGGGLHFESVSATVTGSLIQNNTTAANSAGMFLANTQCEFSNCEISNNTAASEGGGIRVSYDSSDFYNCLITNNISTENSGGGIHAYASTETSLYECNIAGNTAVNGGALYSSNCSLTLSNCQLVQNQATDKGGGAYLFKDSSNVINTTISDNSAQTGGGLYLSDDCSTAIGLCSVTGNSATVVGGIYADLNPGNTVFVSYSTFCENSLPQLIGSWTDGGNNLITELCGLGACCTGNDQICVETNETDCNFFGGAFFGYGVVCSEVECPNSCLGDVTGDGQVNVNDLLTVIANWNNCP